MSRIYVASSWRNPIQPDVVTGIKENTSHEVYDFREPQGNGARGFHWSEIDPKWKDWSAEEYRKALDHTLAEKGFESDMTALETADATVLVLPCGKSAHLELGAARGFGQHTVIYMPVDLLSEEVVVDPELMYKMVDHIFTKLADVIGWAKQLDLSLNSKT